jgi:hypothetical protein
LMCRRHLAHLPLKPGQGESALGAVMSLFVALETRCG